MNVALTRRAFAATAIGLGLGAVSRAQAETGVPALAALDLHNGGRLGVAALDTGTIRPRTCCSGRSAALPAVESGLSV